MYVYILHISSTQYSNQYDLDGSIKKSKFELQIAVSCDPDMKSYLFHAILT